jgi:hypothetical protein
MNTFLRQPLDDRAVIFIIQTDADRWEPPPSSKPTWISLLVGIGVYATTPSPFSLVAAVVAWWLVRKILKRMTGTTRPKIRGTQFIISPQDARGPDGTLVPVSEIKEVVWRDWAIGRSDTGFGVYIERKRGAALTIAKDMDGANAHKLANEIAGVLEVPATEGLARQFTERHGSTPSISIGDVSISPAAPAGGGFAAFAASEAKTPAVPQASVHRADGPQPGDVLLKETGVGTFALQRVTRNGYEHWQDVPHSGLIDAMMFAHATVGDRNLWLEKLVDAGQPTLIPKLSQS